MKNRILTIVSILLCTYSFAQDQKHRISLFTDLDAEMVTETTRPPFWGIQYQYSFTNHQNIVGHLGLDKLGGAIYGIDYIYDISIISDKLEFNIGAGLGRIIYKYNYYMDDYKLSLEAKAFTISGFGGFTYNFTKKPISIFAAYRPKLDLPTFDPIEPTSMLIGLGYRF